MYTAKDDSCAPREKAEEKTEGRVLSPAAASGRLPGRSWLDDDKREEMAEGAKRMGRLPLIGAPCRWGAVRLLHGGPALRSPRLAVDGLVLG